MRGANPCPNELFQNERGRRAEKPVSRLPAASVPRMAFAAEVHAERPGFFIRACPNVGLRIADTITVRPHDAEPGTLERGSPCKIPGSFITAEKNEGEKLWL